MDAMQPYVDWKRTIGRKTTIVSTATTGTTGAAIKSYISNYYNNPANNLAYVLLVGDAPQIPVSYSYTSCYFSPCQTVYSDIDYGKITGGDHYLEVLIGRMSAENVAHVQTQVQRSIEYERDLTTTDTWLSAAIGIAVNEGTGGHDGGEADHVHMNNIRTRLLTYGYNPVHQDYYGNTGVPPTSNTQISQHFNSGVSMGNYCNHGSMTAWTPSYGSNFSNTQVGQLQNAGKLPYLFSVACNNGEFMSGTCFAEAWMRATQNNQPTGAVATFMATISLSWAPPMTAQDEFVDLCLNITHTAGGFSYGMPNNTMRTFAGTALNATQRMIMRHGTSAPTIDDYNAWTVFGDPTLMIRTKTPQAMTVTHSSTIPAGINSLTVNCNAENALAALTYVANNNQVVILGTAVVTGGIATITFSEPATTAMELKLAVTGFNKVTYLGEISVSTTTTPQLCEKPVKLSGMAEEYDAVITWNQPVDIDGVLTGYNIYRDEVLISETAATITEYRDETLAPGSYIYKVSAKYEHCPESELTAGITVVIIYIPVLCEKPVNLSGMAEEYDAVITWNQPVNIDGILTGYNIYRDELLIDETDVAITTYRDEALAPGSYIYKVSAKYEHCEESELTTEVTIEIIYIPVLCEKPENVSGTIEEYDAVIAWNPPVNIDGILLGYNIYRNALLIDETDTTVTEFRDKNLPDGTYTYQISAFYEHCEESELTDGVSVTIITETINEKSSTSFEIYPNPTNGNVTITGNGLNRIEIYDIQGRKLAEYANIFETLQINVNKYVNGIYLIKLFAEEGQIATKRLIIIK
jgi:hypothetical protein